jgi:hypothetical protein
VSRTVTSNETNMFNPTTMAKVACGLAILSS